MAARVLIALPSLARHALWHSPRSASSFRFASPSCAPSRRLLHRSIPAIAMAMAADAPAPAPAPPPTASEKEESEFWERMIAHQKGAIKLSVIEESRVLVDRCSSGILSTFSQKFKGFPYGSFLDYAADEDGSLIIAISSLAPHRKDLEVNGRCCMLIMKDKMDRSDVLVTYMGEASEVSEVEQQKVRDLFLSKHPEAFWVDFGDFKFMRIQPKEIRYTSGVVTAFNRTGDFSGEEFKHANLDPIAGFSTPIATHMNKDHADETKSLVEKSIGIKVENARIIDLDTLGLNVQVVFHDKPVKLRVPFPRPATDRKDVKTLIIQMLEG